MKDLHSPEKTERTQRTLGKTTPPACVRPRVRSKDRGEMHFCDHYLCICLCVYIYIYIYDERAANWLLSSSSQLRCAVVEQFATGGVGTACPLPVLPLFAATAAVLASSARVK